MAVVNFLALDHFYVSIDPDHKDDLLSIFDGCTRVNFSEVQSGDESWSGIYLTDRIGSYFEILIGRRNFGMGMALSSINPMAFDSKKILTEQSDLPWQVGTRTDHKGRPWFDWFSTDNYLDHRATLFNTWIMKYYLNGDFDLEERLKVPTIDSFKKLIVRANPNMLNKIKDNTKWMSGSQKFSEMGVRIYVPRRDEVEFEVCMEWDDSITGFQFKSLELNLFDLSFMNDGEKRSVGEFSLVRNKDVLKLSHTPIGFKIK